MGIGTALFLAKEGIGSANRFLSSKDKRAELKSRGVDIPFHQSFLQSLLGPSIGGRITEASLGRKLARTGGPAGSNIPTRGVLGIGGDAAFADTARAFREQLAKQTAGQISDINRQFAGAGRFTSGQRLESISRIQEGGRQEFGRFLGSTALERFLQQQRLSSAEGIAQAQIEAQSGGGRLGAVTSIFGSLANIFAQNPQFVIDLFTRGGGTVPTGDPFSRFDPNTPGIEVL